MRYGKGITGIRKTTDAEKLYTCIKPTGKDGLTISGLQKKEYDENGNIAFFTRTYPSPQARDRFPSNLVNKSDAYILMRKEYDTSNKEKLYSMALSDLKIASVPVITYEVDGYFDTNIGDTVMVEDQEWTPILFICRQECQNKYGVLPIHLEIRRYFLILKSCNHKWTFLYSTR